MSEIVKIQDPQEVLDYSFDWTLWMASGDTISSSAWAIEPTGPTLTGAQQVGMITTIVVSGPILPGIYRLKNTIVTTNGRTSDRSITIRAFPQ